MYDQIEHIENLANNFDEMGPEYTFMKEKITNFNFPTKFKINFQGCHIAISRNGGLMAICKKKSFLDTQRHSKVNSNVLVMTQNTKQIYTIPITWNYNERYVISFDFTDNGKLYGICNDGAIYKFDILTNKAIEQPTSELFKKEKLKKAKFIENGFIALTTTGDFYYVKDFKNVFPICIFHMSILEFSNDVDVDFIGIPASFSNSRKFELLFTNQKGNGVILVMEQHKDFIYGEDYLIEGGTETTINGVSILENKEIEPYICNRSDISTDINTDNNPNEINNDSMGKIVAMAISPSYSQLALFNNKGIVYIFKTNLNSESKEKKERKEIKIQVNENFSKAEINEQQAIINLYNQEDYQFLFCGEDAIAISGQRFILIANALNKTLAYKIVEGEAMMAIQGGRFSKCISEIDGLRFATNDGIFFISKVDNNLYNTCYPFSNHTAKKLLNAYKSDLKKEANCYEVLNKIYKELPNTILVLANAAANIYWTEEENDGYKKELQFFILKAAQLGKYFVDNEEFNFDKYVEICKNIRIINEIRNNKKSPIFITYKEYENLQYKESIKIITSQLNFNLAFIISKYLGYSTKKIYQKWACCKIKKLSEYSTKTQQMYLFDEIVEELKNIKKISFIKLAKKAFKYKKSDLGMKFLELEKSILSKIPIYLKHNKYDKVLELSYETHDSEIISTCLNEILGFNQIDKDFIDKIKDIKNIKFSIIDFLKKYKPIYIEDYLDTKGEYEELMYLMLENFFTCNKIEDKKKYIKLAKEYQKKLDKTNVNNKFYLLYLNELEHSLAFKKNCMDNERNIIKKSNIEPFDNSIYDCYKLGVKENQIKWIETQNKNYELNPKKMAIMKIRTLAENGKIDMVNLMVKETSLKKLNLTPLNLAELYFDYKQYDLAVEYIKQINNSDYFDYKVDMLLCMEKYREALEVIISSKNMDRIPDMINDILKKKPDLNSYVKELCTKYKVNLN